MDTSNLPAHTRYSTETQRPRAHYTVQLPLTRVRNIIKSDPDTTLAGQEAVLLIAKARPHRQLAHTHTLFITHAHMQATELFIAHLAQKAHAHTLQGKRKTVQRRDIDACVPLHDELVFLERALD